MSILLPDKGKYTTLVGSLSEDSIFTLVKDIVNGKANLLDIDVEKIRFANKNCEDLKQEPDPEEEEDEILKEIIEEEKRKREEFERERENYKKDDL